MEESLESLDSLNSLESSSFQRPSQSPSQSAIFLSELRVLLPLIVLPLKTPARILLCVPRSGGSLESLESPVSLEVNIFERPPLPKTLISDPDWFELLHQLSQWNGGTLISPPLLLNALLHLGRPLKST